MTPRKGIKGGTGGSVELEIPDYAWARIVAEFPKTLSEVEDAALRERVGRCCSAYLTRRRVWLRDIVTAAAMRPPDRKKNPPFKKLVDALQDAADAWGEIVHVYFEHRLGGRPGPDSAAANALGPMSPEVAAQFGGVFHGDVGKYTALAQIARDAAFQLADLQRLGDAVNVANPWKHLVRELAKAYESMGKPATASGGTYNPNSSPSAFQKFVVAVDATLIGERELVRKDGTDKKSEELFSTYTAIAAALAEAPSEG